MKHDLLARMLSKVRKEAGLTQIELCNMLDASQGQISNIERGNSGITMKIVKSYAEAIGGKAVIKIEKENGEIEQIVL